jgi:tRNA A-37 threonylcarbamoyl transferase component Bud32
VADDDRLLKLATAVADTSAVDWDAAERDATDEAERSVVRELRVLSKIGEVARDPAGEMWGPLRILEEIGRGSFAAVYRAWDTRLETEVALKLILPSGHASSVDRDRALKEARLLAKVRHPHVVTVHGADDHNGRFGLWMDLIKGRSLAQLLEQQGPLGAVEAAGIGRDVCQALAAVHRRGLLHRDVKAHNVMREAGGRIVLMDFGAGSRMPDKSARVDARAGTPLYLAPEIFDEAQPSAASDIYSVGVLLYHLVTGAYPVEGRTTQEVEAAHRDRRRRMLRDRRPDLPGAFVAAVERALAPDPRERFKTVGELDSALGRVLDSNPKTWPSWMIAVASAAVVGVLAFGGWLVTGRRESGAPVPATVADRPVPTDIALPAATYQVSAQFFAERDGGPVPLGQGSRIAPGDLLSLTVEASRPLFVYIVNQDDRELHLLFPLPVLQQSNPIPTGVQRLPGLLGGVEQQWRVTSAGGRERFAIYLSPERVPLIEQLTAMMPRAEPGRPVQLSAPLAGEAIGILRSVGGLVASLQPATAPDGLGIAALEPLPDGAVTVTGLFARQIAFENPGPR